jgi:hypothetical protein
MVSWSPDQKYVYLQFPDSHQQTYAFALSPGKYLRDLPPGGRRTADDAAKIAGAQLLPQPRAFAGMNPSEYAYPRVTTQRNIYRVWWLH